MRQNKFQYKANSSMNRSIIDKSNQPNHGIMERIENVSSSEIFARTLFSRIALKDICPTLTIREDFIFTKLRILFREYKTLAKIPKNSVALNVLTLV